MRAWTYEAQIGAGGRPQDEIGLHLRARSKRQRSPRALIRESKLQPDERLGRSRVSLTQRPQIEGSEGFQRHRLSVVILAQFSMMFADAGGWLNVPGARHGGGY
jgi:hypothetical protein